MSLKLKELSLHDLNLDSKNIDLNSEVNFGNYNNLISDWSGIYIEFAFIKRKNLF